MKKEKHRHNLEAELQLAFEKAWGSFGAAG